MQVHCGNEHGKAKIFFDYKKRCVHFKSFSDKVKHVTYVHKKTYGWWLPN